MYSETYVRDMERTLMTQAIDIVNTPDGNAADRTLIYLTKDPTPPEVMMAKEEESPLMRLLREAVTPEEHALLCCIDQLMDEEWRFENAWRGHTGKGLRGELRRMFKGRGLSERRFYAAFHSIERKVCL